MRLSDQRKNIEIFTKIMVQVNKNRVQHIKDKICESKIKMLRKVK